MLTTSHQGRRVSSVVVVAACVLLAAPCSWAAQTPQRDSRWQPWLGCWTPSPAPAGVLSESTAQQVCVVPAAGTSAVDIVTVSGNRILSREHVEASGEHRKSERDGCVGWESAEWSSDARRVYLQSEYDCTGGVKRSTTGLIATSANGDWLDLVGVAMRNNIGVRVLRHHASVPLPTLPAEIASAVDARSRATETLRIASAVWPILNADIVDASRHVNAAVVEAWLAESRQAFTVSAARLVQLADAGVDGRVIDMMVALAYPKVFSIRPSPTTIGALAIKERSGSAGDVIALGSFGDCGPYFSGLSLYGWDGCSPYGYARYGTQYGYSRYDDLLGYGGWYVAGQPVVIIRPSDTPASTHGQVINGRGYTAGTSGDSGATASGSSGSSSAGSSGGGSSAPASSGGDRTAVPR
jgi:uncharacterized membrane protein YgcG